MKRFIIAAFFCLSFTFVLVAQRTATIRGFVYNSDTGEPLSFASVFLTGTDFGTTTDDNGFYNLSEVPAGEYTIMAQFIGYDSSTVVINIGEGVLLNQSFYLKEGKVLEAVNISAEKASKTTEVQVSVTKITPKQITRLPSVGGEPDLAQYLQVLPGVVFTGDQGGQLYIRGGSPVQNKVILDGMTIYNPFHSIGFFSVFETEIIRNADVYTGGFGAEYGGRTSAVIDITTRDGNKKRFGGKVSANPFVAKVLLEGPLLKLDDEKGNAISFLVTGKHSYLPQSSKKIYSYIDTAGLPFGFTDLYGKVSFTSKSGSRMNLFGFNFRDNVDYKNIANIGWNSFGAGTNFSIVPSNAKMILGGRFAYSNYEAKLQEADEDPRRSSVGGFNIGLDLSSFSNNGEFKAGFEIIGFRTDFRFQNGRGYIFDQVENSTEFAGFAKYRYKFNRLIIDPSVRIHLYSSVNSIRIEPRLGLKYNATNALRFKFAGGLYSQNFISAVNERDIVNLFVGFLSAPDETIYEPGSTTVSANTKLQTAIHAIGGVEVDIADNVSINVEPYYKRFPQLINVNRDKVNNQDPNYISETGDAYGTDLSVKYDNNRLYLYGSYSLTYVTRFDGKQTYYPNFDRRHNVNFTSSYELGKRNEITGTRPIELSLRWNLGSGFPFTLTQGFFGFMDFSDGISTDYTTSNSDLGIIYSDKINSGRLPYYHRLDLSAKYTKHFTKNTKMEITVGATNMYNRANIFYFDRIRYQRINQLPILPSASLSLTF